ncbi:phycobilisome linker polypeptide [Altericista sp. CCNU0014]|uniref:phycobilisome linker polypeptide n=1 Tax=Altericista sp. CCNU0014 TaxID=3082949 RepID=UPI00384CAD4F
MLGQATPGAASSTANSRIFIYEVTGLRQNDQTDNSNHPVRNSGSTLHQVPYGRMNSEMRRIARLGGKIVKIYPLSGQTPAKTAPTEE